MDEREEDKDPRNSEQNNWDDRPNERSRLRNVRIPVPWMAEKIDLTPLGDLLPPNRQTRRYTKKQLRLLEQSFGNVGFIVPLIIDANNRIVAGYARYLVAKELGLEILPCIRVTHLNDTELRAFRIFDNRISELGEWDNDELARELQSLIDLDISYEDIGFEIAEVDMLIQTSLAQPHDAALDDAPPTQRDKPAISKLGDRWKLGLHKLLCGDSLDPATILRLLKGILIACALSDVPYNLAVKSFSGRGRIKHAEFAMASGEMTEEEFLSFLKRYLMLSIEYCANGTLLYIFIDWRHVEILLKAGRECDLTLINVVTWVKTNAGMGSFYRSQSEFVVVFKFGDAPHTNNIELGRYGRNRSNVWTYEGANSINPERRKELALHPTVKPARLCADAILDCTARGDIVFDGFLGSGTTLIAAEDTGRICYGIEIDPWYVDTIIRRWEEFTGLEAVNEATGHTFRETLAGQTTLLLPAPNAHKGGPENV